VVGSAIVQLVARLKGAELLKEVGDFIASLKAPLRVK
jgi:tryptophan synthase alpha subunit